MLRLGHNTEIFGSIVALVMIQVMHDFISAQLSPEHLLRDEAMFVMPATFHVTHTTPPTAQ